MVAWADVTRWRREPLFTLMDDCRERFRKARELSDRLVRLGVRFQAEGVSADAIRGFLAAHGHRCDRLVDHLGELMMSAAQAGDSVGRVEIMMEECREYAEANGFRIGEDGSVRVLVDGSNTFVADLAAQEQLRGMIGDLLSSADDLDACFRDRLRAVMEHGTHTGEGHGAFSQGLPDVPEASWSPAEVALWWSNLTVAEREALITHRPEAIGNTNGIDAASRNRANRILLPRRIAEAEEEIKRLRQQTMSSDGQDDDREAWRSALARLADLREVQRTIGEAPERQLLLLDTSAERTRAAVAVGSVDHAQHIATYVPGVGTTVRGGLSFAIGQMDALRETAAAQQSAERNQVSVIAWLGYDAPPDVLAAISPQSAREGAAQLSDFLRGVHASREHSGVGDAHTTVIGHSYGSTTAGMMADRIGEEALDDLIMLGSPGAGVSDASELSIAGTPYVCAFEEHDALQGIGPDSTHGTNPATAEGFIHISNQGPPLERGGLFGAHSDYLRSNPDGTPTPVQIDMSDIIVGGMQDEGET